MDTVSVKFERRVLNNIDKAILHHNYNSRTEFIREAIRDKLETLTKDELIDRFLSLHGKLKGRTKGDPEKHDRKMKELISKEIMADLDRKFR